MKGWYPVAMGWDRAGRNRDRVRTSETGRGRDIACDRGGSLPGGFGRRWWMWRHSGKGELARARTIGELDTAIITLLEADWSLPAASVPISCMINLSVCVCQVSVFVHVCVLTSWWRNLLSILSAAPRGRSPVCVPSEFSAHASLHMLLLCVCVCVSTCAVVSASPLTLKCEIPGLFFTLPCVFHISVLVQLRLTFTLFVCIPSLKT